MATDAYWYCLNFEISFEDEGLVTNETDGYT